jgi:predicted Zn-ribbon and HTH transcriptional regulator
MPFAFDPCDHKIRQLVIRAGKLLRKAKGLPEEKNITIIFEETAPLLGVFIGTMNSAIVDHLPRLEEMKDEQGKLILPAKDCPKCGSKQSVFPMSVCSNCADWKEGYRSSWSCISRGCGYKELLKTSYATLLDEVAPGWQKFRQQWKQTEEGVKKIE